MKPIIVVPTNRSIDVFRTFLSAWETELKGCKLIVVEDRKKKILETLVSCYVDDYVVYDWRDIDKDLGKNSWIIPRQTDCVRSYGYLKALEFNPLFILTLDDDVKPQKDTIKKHYQKLCGYTMYSDEYLDVVGEVIPRGWIAGFAQIGVSHGGWIGSSDVDAITQLTEKEITNKRFYKLEIPKNVFYSMCGMNLAWNPKITKYMYFGLQGKNYPIDRCGDIWAGFYSKLMCDKENIAHVSGYAPVDHCRASNPWANLTKEKNADRLSNAFLKWIRDEENALEYLDDEFVEYFEKLDIAYSLWEEEVDKRIQNTKINENK